MALERRVMWVEGMFLRQHHFQQQDRFIDATLRDRMFSLFPFGWGLRQCVLDAAALKAGSFAFESASGVLPDGTTFSFPDQDVAPPVVELDRDVANQTVYLVLPDARPGQRIGAVRRDGGGEVSTRYVVEETPVNDVLNESTPSVDLQVGSLNLRYEIGDRDRPGFVAMPVARIAERGTDRMVEMVDSFIPPLLAASASQTLTSYVSEVATLLDSRADALAGQYSQVGGSGAAALSEFMLLQIVNAKTCVFNEMRDVQHHHPELIYRQMVELAGQLATFTQEDTRRPPAFPRYDHDNLTATIEPVMEEIRRSLAYLGEQKAVRIPLKVSRHGIHFGQIPDQSLIDGGRFVLVANAAMDSEEFRAKFPRQISIGSVNEIREIIAAADRSVRVKPLPHPPQELRAMAGWLYLEIDKSTSSWGGVAKSQSIAFHHSARFPELEMQLWAIRD